MAHVYEWRPLFILVADGRACCGMPSNEYPLYSWGGVSGNTNVDRTIGGQLQGGTSETYDA